MLYLPVILGTGREGRLSEHAATFVLEQVKAAGHETELIDVRDYASAFTARVKPEGWDDKGAQEKMARADGYIIVSPEYNHSFPGELKIFLDHFYMEYAKKSVGLVGVSMGPWGGARAIESLRIVFGAVDVMVTKKTAMFTMAPKLFAEDGSMDDASREMYVKSVSGMIESTAWFASALKNAREKDL